MKKALLCFCGMMAGLLLAGCAGGGDSPDLTPPKAVTEVLAKAENGKIVITWKDPEDQDLLGIKISNGIPEARALSLKDSVLVEKGIQKYEVANLENGTAYTFNISAVDTSLNESEVFTTEKVTFVINTTENKTLETKTETTTTTITNTTTTTVKKYVCPKDNKEYDTAEAAAACCGVQTDVIKKYICPKDNKEYATAAEAAACCGVETVTKYVCPKDNKEYTTAEAAAACCGVQTVTKYVCSGCNVEYSTKAEADACRCYFDNLTLPDGFVKIAGTTLNIESTYTSNSSYSQILITGRKIKIRDLLVCDHEVTQKEFSRYGRYPYRATGSGEWDEPTVDLGKGDNYPAYFVSWYNAIRYCNMRSITEGLTPCYTIKDDSGNPTTDPNKWFTIDKNNNDVPTSASYTDSVTRFNNAVCDFDANGYRLPTEAEWEYLASANTTNDYAGSSNIDSVAWYSQNADGKVHEVKGKAPNAFGLYDMSGNVGEWCWDWWIKGSSIITNINGIPETGVATQQTESNTPRGRIFKGGNIKYSNTYCKVYSHTESFNESQPYSYGTKTNFQPVGFRVVRTITK